MPLVGTVPVKINSRFAVTLTDFNYDYDRPTQIKAGAAGNIDTATGISQGSGSFKMAIRQDTGLEFSLATLAAEFSINFPLGPNRFALLGCVASKEALSVQQQQGNTEFTINFTFRERKQVR
jgi:hypothetical protein